MTQFNNLFKEEFSNPYLSDNIRKKYLNLTGIDIPLYKTPAVFNLEEIKSLKDVSIFWNNVSKYVFEKLQSKNPLLLERFPEIATLNDTSRTNFSVPPLMRLDTLISKSGTPKIIECNSQFPGNLGINSLQISDFYDESKLHEKGIGRFLPFENTVNFMENQARNSNTITFIEEPNDESLKETKLIGEELQKKGIEVRYRSSDEDLSDLRGAVIKRVVRRNDSLERLVQEGKVDLTNPYWSYVVGNKGLLALLRNPEFSKDFTDEIYYGVDNFLPQTLYIEDLSTQLREQIRTNKDKYVIKGKSSFGGNGVNIGAELTQENWETALNTSLNDNIVQERVDALTYNGMPFDIGIVMIEGKFSNPWARISTRGSLKTNMHLGGFGVACYRK
ncbi:MAG: hypothetical protein ACMXYB_00860 [Candidatus Woesearchaeota archaeon]